MGFLATPVVVIVWVLVTIPQTPSLPRWSVYLINFFINGVFFFPSYYVLEIAKKKGRNFIRIGVLSAGIVILVVAVPFLILVKLGLL